MDVLRRQKDRSYKNVFKGSVLVGTLMDHDESKFATRSSAIKFAQKLLDAGHIESIVGSSVFEDSVHLYRFVLLMYILPYHFEEIFMHIFFFKEFCHQEFVIFKSLKVSFLNFDMEPV